MPTVPSARLKGNYGAAVVMARPSAHALVRPVAADTDVGVDLYCETVAEERPFLHFWVQVKAGNQCVVESASNRASASFEIDKLRYWQRQPVPVFAALVPTEWPVEDDPDVFVVDITTHLLLNSPPGSQEELRLYSNDRWRAGRPNDVAEFLTNTVPRITACLQVSKGIVESTPTPSPRYVKSVPPVPVDRFQHQILRQVRNTAAFSILFALDSRDTDASITSFRQALARILEQFGDDPHWENFWARGCSHHADGDYQLALALYEKARNCIESDPKVRELPEWQRRVFQIRAQEDRARRGLVLQPPVSSG